MTLPDSFLDELVARNEITDVVGSYVQLTKKSGSNMFGLCPFHNEKTPSFSVSSDKQIYHCFGCGKGGGVINFVMEIEGLNFIEAVEFLAKRAGMQMPEDDTPQSVRDRRGRLLSLCKDAARFYYSMLSQKQGEAALQYIKKRGISKQMVVKFGLGAAPDEWTSLTDAMLKKGYTHQELFDAGLCKRSKKGNGSVYDTFRNRLMFPVIDVRGSVIGFSGRALGDNEPKYLNSPDTPIFNKSRNLFAINLAKKSKAGMIILAEGNIDVVSLHQGGFDCAVASLGTSLTAEQARLMSRYTDNVVIAYDADSAGVKAAQRAIGLLEGAGLKVRVLRIPGAKDPDEYIKANGAEAFKRLIESSEGHIDYRLLIIKNNYALDTDDGKIGYLNDASDMLSTIPNAVEREIYAVRVAEETGISPDAVKIEIKKKLKKRLEKEKKRAEFEVMRPASSIQPADKRIKYEHVVSAAAEEGVIRLLLLDPALTGKVGELKPQEFSSPFLQKVFSIIIDRHQKGKDISAASILLELEPEEAQHISLILQKPESVAEGEKAMGDYIERIKSEYLKRVSGDDIGAVAKMFREKKGYGD